MYPKFHFVKFQGGNLHDIMSKVIKLPDPIFPMEN